MASIEKIEPRMVDLPPKVTRTDAIQAFLSQETLFVTIEAIRHELEFTTGIR